MPTSPEAASNAGGVVERLREWAEWDGIRSKYHRPYANPGELRRDVVALLAVVEAAKDVWDQHCDSSLHLISYDRLREALDALYTSKADSAEDE